MQFENVFSKEEKEWNLRVTRIMWKYRVTQSVFGCLLIKEKRVTAEAEVMERLSILIKGKGKKKSSKLHGGQWLTRGPHDSRK